MDYAQDRWSLLIVFQAMDPGKGETIKHVVRMERVVREHADVPSRAPATNYQ